MRGFLLAPAFVLMLGCSLLVGDDDSGGSPQFGDPETIATGQAGVSAIAVDAAAIYWATQSGILRGTRDSEEPCIVITDVATDLASPGGVLVYFTSVFDGNKDRNVVASVPKICLSSRTIISEDAESDGPYVGLDSRGTTLSWYNPDDNTIERGDVDAAGKTVIASDQLNSRATAIDESFVYWVDVDASAVRRGDGVVGIDTIAEEQPEAKALEVDSEHAYWISGDVLHRIPKNGGTSDRFQEDPDVPIALTLFGEDVFWINSQGQIRVVRKQLGDVTLVTTTTPGVRHFVVDAEGLYYTDPINETVVFLPHE